MSLLESIGSPDDVKKLALPELRLLAEEMRAKIIETVKTNGGHLASNLGVIELTIALHRVFDSPRDAIVWDVGHQSYAHKLLTGRVARFSGIRRKGGLSGFPKRSESAHDIFDTGHSSTSISSALGLLEARKLARHDGRVVAVIGDGALTGGMSMEGLGNVAQLGLPLIVILNDNKMSISRNVGAISRYLSRLSASVRYQSMRQKIDATVESIPGVGHLLFAMIVRAKRAVKAIFFKENLFSDLGFEYVGPIDGHNIPLLLSVLDQVRQLERPVVVHVVTTKGKGYDKAEEDPERFHGVSPSCPDARQDTPFFTEVFGETMMELAEERRDLVAVAAAMTKGNGLEAMAKRFPSQVFDVGIAEQHAVTFAAGLATGGRLPVVAIYSTFMQRAMDQVIHDVALPDIHVVFALDRSGAVGEDGETHQGFYDIALFKGLPHMTMMAPADSGELRAFLRYAVDRKGPAILRYPKSRVACAEGDAAPVVLGRGVLMREDSRSSMLVCALGPLAYAAARAVDGLADEGVFADVYSLRFVAPIDEAYLSALCRRYREVITVEDGSVAGGVGESIAAILSRSADGPRVTILGFPPAPPAQATRDELLRDAGLDESGIASAIRNLAAESAGAELRDALSIASGL
ncbi:1-deoxy-D-xylulose-5-phosphate synthase [bacterium]|nr:1-deoxy-D-xylulose-5-phosphate synthase [bacterium]